MKIYEILVVFSSVLLFACNGEEKSDSAAAKLSADSTIVVKEDFSVKPKIKPFTRNIDSTVFSEGSIYLGSTAMIFPQEVRLFADSNMLPDKNDRILKRGDKVRVKSIHDRPYITIFSHFIYKVELIDSNETVSGYLQEDDMAFYFKQLPDGRTLINGFAKPYQDEEKFMLQAELLIVNNDGKVMSSIIYSLSDTIAMKDSNNYYFGPDIITKLFTTKALGDPKLAIKVILGYGGCGYYTNERVFVES